MSKSVLIWGAPNRVDSNVDYKTAFIQSGNNFGNMLIGNSVRMYLETENTIISREELKSPQEVDERCSHVVIPAANFLWKDFDFGYIYDFLKNTKVPVTIIGVGAQTNDRSQTSPIHPNTLRLMKMIAERSKTLGVRGFYTAEVLAYNGIHNVEIIGCPSIYSSRQPTVKIDTSKLDRIDLMSVNFSRRVKDHSFNPEKMRQVENEILKIAIKNKSPFVAQDEIEEIGLSFGETVNLDDIKYYFPGVPFQDVTDYFKQNTRFFSNYPDWAKFIQERSLSIGTRFHGNLIALINKIPAFTIIHDSRTMEMCSLLGVPGIHLNQIMDNEVNEEFFLEKIKSMSFDRFESTYEVLYKRFVKFLGDNSLKHNLPTP